MHDLDFHIGELVIANRILANEGVVDAYGHVSMRHPHHLRIGVFRSLDTPRP